MGAVSIVLKLGMPALLRRFGTLAMFDFCMYAWIAAFASLPLASWVARAATAAVNNLNPNLNLRDAGTGDGNLRGFDEVEVSSPSEDASEDDSDEDRYRDRERYGGAYGRSDEARRRKERKAEKAEARRRKIEKKMKRRQREMERSYAIYIQCVPPSD